MPPLSPHLADKNSLTGKGYKLCVEFLYDSSSANPALWQYFRATSYDLDLAVQNLEQLGNPGVIITATFNGGFPIGEVEETRSLDGDIPTFDIPLSNIGRDFMSICEFYELEDMPGRLLWVHPDYLSSGAAEESRFSVHSARATKQHGIITATAVRFNPFATQIPREVVTTDQFPGVVGSRVRYLV